MTKPIRNEPSPPDVPPTSLRLRSLISREHTRLRASQQNNPAAGKSIQRHTECLRGSPALLQSPQGVMGLTKTAWELPHTLGALRQSHFSEAKLGDRSVKDELRANLICRVQRGETLFPGIIGYEDSVVPHIVNAVLSRHNFILLGLRGQAKTRLIRMLTTLLDPWAPYVDGCEIHDNPYRPICRRCRDLIAQMADETPIAYLS